MRISYEAPKSYPIIDHRSVSPRIVGGEVLILGIEPGGHSPESAQAMAEQLKSKLPGLADVILVGGFNGHVIADPSVLDPKARRA
jgi:hypothetical protein